MYLNGGCFLVMGNGGFSIDVGYIVVEFFYLIIVGWLVLDVIDLIVDIGMIIVIGNDFSFEEIFKC